MATTTVLHCLVADQDAHNGAMRYCDPDSYLREYVLIPDNQVLASEGV